MQQVKDVSLAKIRWKLFLLGFFKIPMIGFVKPKIGEINDEEVSMTISLRRRTKNHLNSMYFGALAVGADVASGIHVFYLAEKYGHKVSFAFKSIEGEFIKRAETNVTFVFGEGARIKAMLEESITSGSRINDHVTVKAFNSNREEVAIFRMGVSVRVK